MNTFRCPTPKDFLDTQTLSLDESRFRDAILEYYKSLLLEWRRVADMAQDLNFVPITKLTDEALSELEET